MSIRSCPAALSAFRSTRPPLPSRQYRLRTTQIVVTREYLYIKHRKYTSRACAADRDQTHLLRSNISSTSTSLGLGVILAFSAVLIYAIISPVANPDDSYSSIADTSTSSDHPRPTDMPDMEIPPGRPGNLTPDQEAKLRELWEAVGNLTGITPDMNGQPGTPNRSHTPSISSASPDSAKKKRRFGLLGRKQSNADSADADGDDKHGQSSEFRAAISEMTPAQLRETLWSFNKADDPDAMLLRFLRARKWNVQNALVMMISTIRWRGSDIRLDSDIMRRGEQGMDDAANGVGESEGKGEGEKSLGHDFMAQCRMGKSFLHGADKQGRPMCYVRVRLHRGGEQSQQSLERYTVFTIETARLLLCPPVDTAVLVFDMTGFTMANMDYTPVKFMIKVFEANYPESLGAVLVHKAPWIFHGIWKIIHGWLDPVVASKVHFTKSVADLAEYIDRDQIPTELDGDEDWEYKYEEPVKGENDLMRDTATRDKIQAERQGYISDYERATLDWVASEGKDEAAAQTRRDLAQRMRENYWRLDPYVRARSLLDRTGVIQGGGVIDFYPKAAPPSKAIPQKDGTSGPTGLLVPGRAADDDDDSKSVKSVYYDALSEID